MNQVSIIPKLSAKTWFAPGSADTRISHHGAIYQRDGSAVENCSTGPVSACATVTTIPRRVAGPGASVSTATACAAKSQITDKQTALNQRLTPVANGSASCLSARSAPSSVNHTDHPRSVISRAPRC